MTKSGLWSDGHQTRAKAVHHNNQRQPDGILEGVLSGLHDGALGGLWPQLHSDGGAGRPAPSGALLRGRGADPGGRICINEHPVCWFHWKANIPTIGEGTHEVQQMVTAWALGT